jgi:hypothetical protein
MHRCDHNLIRRVDRNWFNEPFAVSAVHGRVLGLAWLSLGDEHTTTVRIKRVSLSTPAPAPAAGGRGPGAGRAFFSRERAVFARDRGLLGSCPGPARTAQRTVEFAHGPGLFCPGPGPFRVLPGTGANGAKNGKFAPRPGLFLPQTGGLDGRPGPLGAVENVAPRGGRNSASFSRERAVLTGDRGLSERSKTSPLGAVEIWPLSPANGRS